MNNGKTHPGSERCTVIKQSRGKKGKSLTGWDVSLTLGKPSRNPWGAMIPRLRDVILHMLCWLMYWLIFSLSTVFVFLIHVSITFLRPKWGAAYRSGGQISKNLMEIVDYVWTPSGYLSYFQLTFLPSLLERLQTQNQG